MRVPALSPRQVAERLAAGEPDLVLLDVREPEELALARIEGVRHVPMGRIPAVVETFERDRTYVVVCHHGRRSARVCAYLLRLGFLRVYNLSGGIEAWSLQVDRGVPRY